MAQKRSQYGRWKCECCNLVFETRAKLFEHNHIQHPVSKGNPWNKGLTKETDKRILKCSNTFKTNYNSNEFIHWNKNKTTSDEMKEKISNGMKLAHKEKRAHNIGKSRWNNKPSYPEQWFINVISNEFSDKQYIREYPLGIYSLDFAWPHLKKCIEIDGEQHHRFKEYEERDKRKDEYLTKHNWKVLRISWKECFHNPKQYIKKAKSFINN